MWGLKGGIRCGWRSIVCKGKLGAEESGERRSKTRGHGGVKGRQNGFKEVKEGLDSCNGIRNVCDEDVAMLAEMRMWAYHMKMMKGARKGRGVGEGAERTGGEGGGYVIGVIWVMGKNFVVMLSMVLGGDVQETSVAESLKVMEKLKAWRVAKGGCRIMEVGVVLSYPTGGEETMFGGYVMTKGMSEVQ